MGVFTRGTKLWIRFKDADGAWRNIASGFAVGQEELARARCEELEAASRATRCPVGLPISFRVIAKFGDGSEAELIAVKRADDLHEFTAIDGSYTVWAGLQHGNDVPF